MLTIEFNDGSVLDWQGHCFKSWELDVEEGEINLYGYKGKIIATYNLTYIKRIEEE